MANNLSIVKTEPIDDTQTQPSNATSSVPSQPVATAQSGGTATAPAPLTITKTEPLAPPVQAQPKQTGGPGIGQTIKDLALSGMQGAAAAGDMTVGALDWATQGLVNQGFKALTGEDYYSGIQDRQDYWGQGKSPEAVASEQAVSQGFNEGVIPGIKALATNPRGAASIIAQQAAPFAEMAALTYLGVPPVLTGGAMSAGTAAAQAKQDIYEAPAQQILSSERGKELSAQGLNLDQIREQIAVEGANKAAPLAGALGAVASKVTGAAGLESKAFGHGGRFIPEVGEKVAPKTLSSLAMEAGKGVLKEGAQEALQEGAEQYSGNVGSSAIYPERSNLEGVAANAALGGITGGLFGGLTGGMAEYRRAGTNPNAVLPDGTITNNSEKVDAAAKDIAANVAPEQQDEVFRAARAKMYTDAIYGRGQQTQAVSPEVVNNEQVTETPNTPQPEQPAQEPERSKQQVLRDVTSEILASPSPIATQATQTEPTFPQQESAFPSQEQNPTTQRADTNAKEVQAQAQAALNTQSETDTTKPQTFYEALQAAAQADNATAPTVSEQNAESIRNDQASNVAQGDANGQGPGNGGQNIRVQGQNQEGAKPTSQGTEARISALKSRQLEVRDAARRNYVMGNNDPQLSRALGAEDDNIKQELHTLSLTEAPTTEGGRNAEPEKQASATAPAPKVTSAVGTNGVAPENSRTSVAPNSGATQERAGQVESVAPATAAKQPYEMTQAEFGKTLTTRTANNRPTINFETWAIQNGADSTKLARATDVADYIGGAITESTKHGKGKVRAPARKIAYTKEWQNKYDAAVRSGAIPFANDTRPINPEAKQDQAYIRVQHKRAIRAAIAEGKQVPAEVLAEYPDLKTAVKTGPAHSTSEKAGTGSTVTELTNAIKRDGGQRAADFLNSDKVVLHEDASTLPKGLRRDDAVQGVYYDGKIHLVAGNIARGDEYGVLLHEAGVHAGMRAMLGDELYGKVRKEVIKRIEKGDRELAQALSRTPWQTNPELFTEEAIAYLAEKQPQLPLLRQIAAAVRQWLIKNFGLTRALNADALTRIAQGSLQRLTSENDGPIYTDGKASESTAYAIKAPETEEFKKWFGNSKVVDADGKPRPVYHGTTADFASFDKSRATKDNDFGAGFYFTSSPADAGANYTKEGPDLTYRIERETQRLMHSEGLDRGQAQQKARDKYVEHDGITMPVFLRMEKPVVIGGDQQTEFNDGFLHDLAGVIGNNAKELSDVDHAQADQWVDQLSSQQAMMAEQLVTEVNDSAIGNARNDDGDLVSGEVLRKSFEDVGYDGIIDNTVSKRFGDQAQGMDKDTVHYVAFRPEQIKSAIGNNGDFGPTNPDIRYSTNWKDELTPEQQAAVSKIGAGPKKPVLQRVKDAVDYARKSWRQGIIDKFDSLKKLDEKLYGKDVLDQDAALSSWALAKLSGNDTGGVEALLHDGALEWNGGALDTKTVGKGLTSILQPLGDEVDRFMAWVAGNRASKLKGEGRENLFTDQDINALIELNKGAMADGQSRAQVYAQAWGKFNALNQSVVKLAVDAGLIDGAEAQRWAGEFYVPFYRILDEEGVKGPKTLQGLTNQEAYKRLKGGDQKLNDLLGNTLLNWQHLISASLKNKAGTQALKNAEQLGIAERVKRTKKAPLSQIEGNSPDAKGTQEVEFDATSHDKNAVFILENGKRVYYTVSDPLVLESISALSNEGFNNPAMRVLRAFKRAFTHAVTISPEFAIANLLRDQLQAIATSKLDPKMAGFNNVVTGFKALGKDSLTRARMQASGGLMSFGHAYGADPDSVKKQLKGEILTASNAASILRKGWNAYSDLRMKAENANRAALYEQMIAQGKSHLQASLAARDLMDFGAGGAWPAVRFLTQVTPFLNARIQGLDKLGRSIADKQQRGQFAAVTGAVALASALLYLAYKDDKDFQEREEWDRDTYWWFKVGDTQVRIPKPFEVGSIATLFERGIEQMVDDKVHGDLFAERLGAMLTQTFAMNPVPQIMVPALETFANKSMFTGRQIEPISLQGMSPEERQNVWTSNTAIALSDGYNKIAWDQVKLSPLQVEHLIRGYAGWVGATALGIIDKVVAPLTGAPEKPSARIEQYPAVGRFFRESPAGHSKYETLFYEQLKASQQAYNDLHHYLKLGDAEGAKRVAASERASIARYKPLNSVSQQLTALNNQVKLITLSRSMGADEKRQRIDRIQEIKNRLTKSTVDKLAG